MTKLKRKEETVMKIEEIAESIDGELEDARLQFATRKMQAKTKRQSPKKTTRQNPRK